MNISIITQARTGSKRLPSKILKNIGDVNMLQMHLRRAIKSKLANQFIVATTFNSQDDIISEQAINEGFKVYRGKEDDVLDRYYQAAKKYKSDIIVRITSDCPLIDPILIDKVIEAHIINNKDFTSNISKRTYPDGFDVEVFNFKVLEQAWLEAKDISDREHVTYYIWKNNNHFSKYEFVNEIDYSYIRLTLDYIEDYQLFHTLILNIGYYKSWKEYVEFLIQNKQLLELNKIHIH